MHKDGVSIFIGHMHCLMFIYFLDAWINKFIAGIFLFSFVHFLLIKGQLKRES